MQLKAGCKLLFASPVARTYFSPAGWQYIPLACLFVVNSALPVVFANEAEPTVELWSLSIEELLDTTVTAQRRVQKSEDVPFSVSIISGELLDVFRASGQDIRQLSGRSPSLIIESSFGRTFPRFYLRGMGNTDFDVVASQPVSLVMDEVVLENALLKGFPLFDLERVEVLRGPQGSLFGRNTTAGVVKLESRRPRDYFEAKVIIGVGEHDVRNLDVVLNFPTSSNSALRLSGLHQYQEDWIKNAAPNASGDDDLGGHQDSAMRLQWQYSHADNFHLLLNYHARTTDTHSRVFRANIIQPGSAEPVSNFNPRLVYQDAAQDNSQTIDIQGFSTKLSLKIDEHTLYYVGAFETAEVYSRGDIDGGYGRCANVMLSVGLNSCERQNYANQSPYFLLPAMGPGFIPSPSETGVAMPDHHQTTHELRWSNNGDEIVDYQLGLFLFDESIEIHNFSFNTLAGGVQNGFSRQYMQTQSWATFSSLDYAISEKYSVILGARYSDESRDWHGELMQSPIGLPASTSQAAVQDAKSSWDVSLLYRAGDNSRYYVRIAEGYRAPSIQGRNLLFSAPPTTADSETLLSYEIGMKSKSFGQRSKLSVSGYYYIANDQQLTAVGGGSNVARLLNIDHSTGYGAELEAEMALSKSWLWLVGASYNHTEIHAPGVSVGTCSGGCSVRDPLDANNRAIINGNALPQAPEWMLNTSLRYSLPYQAGEFIFLTDWAYRSEIQFFLYQSEEFRDRYWLEGGLKFAYQWQNGKHEKEHEIALVGRNITNHISLEGGIDFNNLTGFINEPRYVGVEWSAVFR